MHNHEYLFCRMSLLRKDELLFQICMSTSIALDILAINVNGLLAYVLQKHRKTRILTFWFIYCLSISDVMVGITGLIDHALQLDLLLEIEKVPWNILHKLFGEMHGYFLLTSWMVILIIAVDRCFHMNYPHNYDMIMTKFRARAIMICNIIFCVILELPLLLTSGAAKTWFLFSRYVFYAVGLFLIFALYLLLYFSIKRQANALQIYDVNHLVLHDAPVNSNNYQYLASSARHCFGSGNMNKCNKDNTRKEFHAQNSCIIKKENSYEESARNSYHMPACNTANHSNSFDSNEEVNGMQQQGKYINEALQFGTNNDIDTKKASKQKSECQCQAINANACSERTKKNLNKNIETFTEFDASKLTRQKQDENGCCHSKIIVLPNSANCSISKLNMKRDLSDEVEYIAVNEAATKNVAPLHATEKAYNETIAESGTAVRKPVEGARLNQVSRRRRSTPDEEVKKATCLILLAVFVCYVPGITNYFHSFATGAETVAMLFISQVSVLLNSSLNAVILLVCSKDIQRKVGALWIQR